MSVLLVPRTFLFNNSTLPELSADVKDPGRSKLGKIGTHRSKDLRDTKDIKDKDGPGLALFFVPDVFAVL